MQLRRPITGKLSALVSKQRCCLRSYVSIIQNHQFGSTYQHRNCINVRCAQNYNLQQHCWLSSGSKDINTNKGNETVVNDNTSDGSSSTAEDDIDCTAKDNEENKSSISSEEKDVIKDEDNMSSDPVHFPWRHEADPPARIEAKDDLSGMPNNFRSRFVRRLVACRELNLTPLDAISIPFYSRSWEDELANNFKGAFELALQELLRSVLHCKVEVKGDAGEQGVLSIDTSIKSDSTENDGNDKVDTNSIEDNAYLNQMLDKKLIEKYNINTDNMNVKLSIKPIEANLETIFAIPLLSREIVERLPHLEGAYQQIERTFEETKSYQEVKKMTFDLANEIGEEDAFTRTVIADCVVYCSEFFQVKDELTGLVIQGMEDDQPSEEIAHNVRFEVVTEKSEDGGFGRKLNQWKIIDIDDQLEGNVFH